MAASLRLQTSILPPSPTLPLISKPKPKPKPPTISCSYSSSSINLPRFPSLDRRASAHSRLRFVRKLTTLLLSKPRHFLPLRILSRCRRRYLSPPPSLSLLSVILRYPSLFRLFHSPSFSSPSLSLLSVTLTPAYASLAAHESHLRCALTSSLAAKLHRLLMLSPHRRLLLSKLVHLAPDLALAPNFRSRLCNSQPDRFRTIHTSYGRALDLVSWDPSLAAPLPKPLRADADDLQVRPIIDRPPKFKQIRLRRGLSLKRRHRDFLIRLQELPEVNPYLRGGMLETPEMKEKRACAVVREVLAMTTEKRTLVDHLTHFRKDFGLPNRLHAMLVRHPEMFYVSVKGVRDSVFLVEAYDEKGRLLVEDEMKSVKERLVELVKEGKRMRREWKRGCGYGNDVGDDEGDEEDDDLEGGLFEDDDDDDDGLSDLFEAGIGDDWEEIGGDVGSDYCEEELKEVDEFWLRKAIDESVKENGGLLEAW